MAEALAVIGAIASISQLAEYGFKLSVKLFAFSETVATADRSVKSLSNEISLTSTVLRELSELLRSENRHGPNHASPGAIEATEKTVKECFEVFEQLNKALEKSVGDVSGGKDGSEKKKLKKLERLKWSFFQPRMDLLRSNLDRLKSSLVLMLQVLMYARDIGGKKAASPALEYQKDAIESLARSAHAADIKYQALQRAIKITPDSQPGEFSTENLSRATTFVAHSISSEAGSQERSLDRGSIETVQPAKVPDADIKPLIGELILCFNLVHNLLSHHMGIASNSEMYKMYLTLRRAVESAHKAELESLEKQYGDTAYVIGAAAAKNALRLQQRLRELARPEYSVAQQQASMQPSLHKSDGQTVKIQESLRKTAEEVQGVGAMLSQESKPCDPYISHEENNARIQAEIDSAVGIMRENAAKANERGSRLDALEDKTDNLAVSAQRFRRGANRVRKAKPWINLDRIVASTTVGLLGAAAGASAGAQWVAEGLSTAGSGITSAFTAKDEPKDTAAKVWHGFKGYASAIERLDDLNLATYTQEDGADESNVDVVRQLLTEWTTLGPEST